MVELLAAWRIRRRGLGEPEAEPGGRAGVSAGLAAVGGPGRGRQRPLRILELSGSPEELGRLHGRAVPGEIRRLRRTMLSYLACLGLYVGAWPLYGLLLFLAWRYWPYIPQRFKQEMMGVAAGAEVSLGTVLLLNVIDDIANNKNPRCLALAVGEQYTATGAYLMGRNLDYPVFTEVMMDLQTWLILESEGGLPVASLGWPGYVGVSTGMNRAGVALAQMTAMGIENTYKGVPAALRFRQALEEEGTVTGVASRILKMPGTIGNNLMLCGPGEAVVLELSSRHAAQRFPVAGLLSATTHYQSAEMAPYKGRYPPRPPFARLSHYHYTEAYSRARDARARELAWGRKLGSGEVQAILADSHIANHSTAVSAVFAPAELTAWVARGERAPVCHGPFEPIRPWGR